MNQEPIVTAPVVTVDGPSGSGKGTVGLLLAGCLGYRFLDSGALYRVAAICLPEDGPKGDSPDPVALSALAELDIEFRPGSPGEPPLVIVRGEDVTARIRTEAVGARASELAASPGVRSALLAAQRRFRAPPGLVADGRDMGTVVFPDAEVKVFLTASLEARAGRRYKQLKEKGLDVRLASVLSEIERRDARDMARVTAPLKAAPDAWVLDTSSMSVAEVVSLLCRRAQEVVRSPVGKCD